MTKAEEHVSLSVEVGQRGGLTQSPGLKQRDEGRRAVFPSPGWQWVRREGQEKMTRGHGDDAAP